MEDIVMRNIYQIMVDMLNEMKRFNDTIERLEKNAELHIQTNTSVGDKSNT